MLDFSKWSAGQSLAALVTVLALTLSGFREPDVPAETSN
jgi:hypothetical protein